MGRFVVVLSLNNVNADQVSQNSQAVTITFLQSFCYEHKRSLPNDMAQHMVSSVSQVI